MISWYLLYSLSQSLKQQAKREINEPKMQSQYSRACIFLLYGLSACVRKDPQKLIGTQLHDSLGHVCACVEMESCEYLT